MLNYHKLNIAIFTFLVFYWFVIMSSRRRVNFERSQRKHNLNKITPCPEYPYRDLLLWSQWQLPHQDLEQFLTSSIKFPVSDFPSSLILWIALTPKFMSQSSKPWATLDSYYAFRKNCLTSLSSTLPQKKKNRFNKPHNCLSILLSSWSYAFSSFLNGSKMGNPWSSAN
jgi:hypothetical protein